MNTNHQATAIKNTSPISRVFSRTFRVRHYECDAYGHLNNANYVRFMQETAFDASADAGYDMRRYVEMNHYWLIRGTDIEYLRPLQYNDSVRVKTWVADFRRATSRRAYEFTHAETGEVVARGYTDWVFLNRETQQPARVPDEIVKAFFPDGLAADQKPREPFPSAPPPPPGVFRMNTRVRWQDIDPQGHVNNAAYLSFIEDCAFQVIAAHRWPVQRMTEAGFAILIRRHQVQYLQQAYLDDELEIATWASEIKRSTALRHYTVQRISDGAMLARVHSLGVWIDLKQQRPVRIPADFLQDFAANLVM